MWCRNQRAHLPYADKVDGYSATERSLETFRNNKTVGISLLVELVSERYLFGIVLGKETDLHGGVRMGERNQYLKSSPCEAFPLVLGQYMPHERNLENNSENTV